MKARLDKEYLDESLRDRIRQQTARTLLDEYQVPGARNEASVDESAYGRNVRPYLRDASSAGEIGLKIPRILRGLVHP